MVATAASVNQAEPAGTRDVALAAEPQARADRLAPNVRSLDGHDPGQVYGGQDHRVEAQPKTVPEPRADDSPVQRVAGSTPGIAAVAGERPSSVESGTVVRDGVDEGLLAAPVAAALTRSWAHLPHDRTRRFEARLHKHVGSRSRARVLGALPRSRRSTVSHERRVRPRRWRAPARAPCRMKRRRLPP
jgi:hypothetical protein